MKYRVQLKAVVYGYVDVEYAESDEDAQEQALKEGIACNWSNDYEEVEVNDFEELS